MSFLDDIKQKYDEMDSVQRQNFWYAVVGLILLLLLLASISDTFGTIGAIFGNGAKYVNSTVSNANGLIKR